MSWVSTARVRRGRQKRDPQVRRDTAERSAESSDDNGTPAPRVVDRRGSAE